MSEPKPRARRCAMCGMVNRPNAQTCECGYHFEDEGEDLGAFLRSRVVNGWIMVIGGLVLTIFSVFVIVFARWPGILIAVPSVALFTKGTRVIDAARRRLRDLPVLPKAKVLED